MHDTSRLRLGGLRVSLVLLTILAISSCGSRAASSSSTESSRTTGRPATSLFVRPTPNPSLVAAMKPVYVTEPCPSTTLGPDGSADMMTELSRLEPMLGQVLTYGGQHSVEFGSYGLVWKGSNDASVFVSFTSNLPAHRAALSKIVAHPDELIVCQVAVSNDVARALLATLTDQLQGRFRSMGVGGPGVEIVLATGEEALAAELSAKYGDAVAVNVCSEVNDCIVTAG
jgi:hypothetical protein